MENLRPRGRGRGRSLAAQNFVIENMLSGLGRINLNGHPADSDEPNNMMQNGDLQPSRPKIFRYPRLQDWMARNSREHTTADIPDNEEDEEEIEQFRPLSPVRQIRRNRDSEERENPPSRSNVNNEPVVPLERISREPRRPVQVRHASRIIHPAMGMRRGEVDGDYLNLMDRYAGQLNDLNESWD